MLGGSWFETIIGWLREVAKLKDVSATNPAWIKTLSLTEPAD